jgi:hypothetical protein
MRLPTINRGYYRFFGRGFTSRFDFAALMEAIFSYFRRVQNFAAMMAT